MKGWVDWHTHNRLCRHARGDPADYARAAAAAGLAGLGASDHAPMPGWFDPAARMSLSEFETYLRLVEEARSAAGGLEVLLGLELDLEPGTENWAGRLLASAPFGYVLGSIHFIGAWPFDDPAHAGEFERRDLRQVYREYYRSLARGIDTGSIDIVAHLDLPKKFGHRLSDAEHLEVAAPALDAIVKAGVAVEINTAGWRKPVGEAYPGPALLAEIGRRGVPVTLGSDAHLPAEVGYRFDDALELARQAGIGHLAVFRNRVRELVPLAAAGD